jgi:acetone carboxylase, alpha subunit
MTIDVGSDRTAAAQPLKDALVASEAAFERTGHYAGLETLELRRQDPLKYESLQSRLRSTVASAREMMKRVSASPGVAEVGEGVVALYTPEGDSIVLSTGIMVHVHTMSAFIKWMLRNDYERDVGIAPGDIFANNDAYIGNVQPPDMQDVVPIYHGDELVGWAGCVTHELECGGITPGGDVALAAERYTEGLSITAEKIGSGDEVRRDYWVRCERNVRTPKYWILDEKARIGGCLQVRERVLDLIDEVGIDYYRRAVKEYIEEGRRAHLARMRAMTVPGRYRGVRYLGILFKDKPGILPMAARNWMYAVPIEMTIAADGKVTLDLEGTGPPGWHSCNASRAAVEGPLFVALTQFTDNDGKVNDGAYLATELRLPKGAWCNPGSEVYATTLSWQLTVPAMGNFLTLMSRAFLARGFKEEIFVGAGNNALFEGGGFDAAGAYAGGANFELAATGSGARGVADGIDTGYVLWNPEADMGNAEVWELDLPILYLGRRLNPYSYGAGKFRGGAAMQSVWKFHRTAMFSATTADNSGGFFDTAGMCGGYPAPTAYYQYDLRNTNIADVVAERKPLPHAEGDPAAPSFPGNVEGDLTKTDGGFVGPPFKHDDLFVMSYLGGSGYGDPIDRDPELVCRDVNDGIATADQASGLYGVVLKDAGHGNGVTSVDTPATTARRNQIRTERLARGVPTKEWMTETRAKVLRRELHEDIVRMYTEMMELSSAWRSDYLRFWDLPDEFDWAESERP